MRRLFVGLAIFTFALLAPLVTRADDQKIATEIISKLEELKDNGSLRKFQIDLQVDDGTVWMKGSLASKEQRTMALEVARRIRGVKQVVNDLEVREPAARTEKKEAEPAKGLLPKLSFASKKTEQADKTTTSRRTAKPVSTTTSNSKQGDNEIAQLAIAALKKHNESGALRDFDLDVDVTNGSLWAKGRVASEQQQLLVLETVRRIRGVKQVVNDLKISPTARTTKVATAPAPKPQVPQPITQPLAKEPTSIPHPVAQPLELDPMVLAEESKPAVDYAPMPLTPLNVIPTNAETAAPATETRPTVKPVQLKPVAPAPQQVAQPAPQQVAQAAPQQVAQAAPQQAPAARVAGQQQVQYVLMPVGQAPRYVRPQTPLAFAPAQRASYNTQISNQGAPIPTHMPSSGVGIAPARYDHPNMPGYAWPSYAPYPNYGAVTYPKQYSPTAWPYIGPFYPYPQVPLGWRKVTLQWDDGWWFLDFKSK